MTVMSEWILYACASAVLCGLLPSFMKLGVRRAAPSVAAALYASVVFLFALGAVAISDTFAQVRAVENSALLSYAVSGLLRAVVWLCLFTALSTGGVNRVMPVHNLAAAAVTGLTALLLSRRLGVWPLCCIVLLLLGTVLMESRQQKGRGLKWLLFAVLALLAETAKRLFDASYLSGTPVSVVELLGSFTAMILLWGLSALGRSFGSLGKLKAEDWLFVLLAGVSTGLAWLCDASAARLGDSTYLLPIACCAFPLMMVFARLLNKERMPGAAVLGVVLAVFGMFGLLLGL